MNWIGLFLLIAASLFSLIMIMIGLGAFKSKKIWVSSFPLVAKYEGSDAHAPSILFIFIGSIFPLLLLSTYANLVFKIDRAMPIFFGIAAFIAVFSIFYFKYGRK